LQWAVKNLDDAPLVLLVRRVETESKADLSNYLQAHYDAHRDDPEWGPRYRVGPTFRIRDQRFAQIQTFAGSLVVQIVFDTRNRKFERPVIFRFSTEDQLALIGLDGSSTRIDDSELIQLED
jgi:hypothetical protein